MTTPTRISKAIPHICGIPTCHRYAHLLIMFRSFIDETEAQSKQGKQVFCFFGWVATADEWERFSNAWYKELHQKPSIDYFKHYEAKSQTGQFQGWPKSKCEAKILSLSKIIANSEIKYGATTSVRTDQLREMLKSCVLPVKTVRSILHASRPYDWAFHSIVSMILQLQVNLGETEPIDFVFDEGDAAFDDCARRYREFRALLPRALSAIAGTVLTANDKMVMPLQAADLIAGEATVRLRCQPASQPYKLIHENKTIFSCPVTLADKPFSNFPELLSLLNIIWATRVLEKVKGKNEK